MCLQLGYKPFCDYALLLRVCIWRHGGHVGVQNNAVICLLGIWLYYYAKPIKPYSMVLYTNIAVSSHGCKPRISITTVNLVWRCTPTFHELNRFALSNQGFTHRCHMTRARAGPVEAFCRSVLSFNTFIFIVLASFLLTLKVSILTWCFAWTKSVWSSSHRSEEK